MNLNLLLEKRVKYIPLSLLFLLIISCSEKNKTNYKDMTVEVLQDTIIELADKQVNEEPITVTASFCERSAGGIHDFYSEGDYWWPNPEDPDGPYIRKDGMTNPGNFTAHREAMIRFSIIVGNLTSAFLITKDSTYSDAVIKHLKAWFIDDSTKMTPNLLYAQAIKGIHTGRGIGIIDAIHLMEVVQAVKVLEKHNKIDEDDFTAIKQWFSDFITWLTTHPYGKDEMVHPNNHGTCWNMQVAIFARLTENDSILNFCRENYKNTLLPNQMAVDGSFPLELERTKPYGYSLFNLDAMVMNCLILSDEEHDLWSYETDDGKTILKGLEYMAPYVADKSSWPLEPDVMYWENWPVAHPSFLFGTFQFNRDDYFELWKNNKHFLEVKEVIRNVPIRNPLIWLHWE